VVALSTKTNKTQFVDDDGAATASSSGPLLAAAAAFAGKSHQAESAAVAEYL